MSGVQLELKKRTECQLFAFNLWEILSASMSQLFAHLSRFWHWGQLTPMVAYSKLDNKFTLNFFLTKRFYVLLHEKISQNTSTRYLQKNGSK